MVQSKKHYLKSQRQDGKPDIATSIQNDIHKKKK